MAINQKQLDKYIEATLDEENIKRKQQVYADILAKYWGDPDFKAKLDADPTSVLRAEGYEVPEGAMVKLVFNTEKRVHIVLPAPREYGG